VPFNEPQLKPPPTQPLVSAQLQPLFVQSPLRVSWLQVSGVSVS
jgi:hypothetical protein